MTSRVLERVSSKRYPRERHRQRHHERRDQQRSALSHLFSPPFLIQKQTTDYPLLGGSRLRHWLCSSLLSAHLPESELVSLYLGWLYVPYQTYYERFYRRPRLPDGIHLRLLARYEPVAIRPTSPRTAFAEEVRSGHTLTDQGSLQRPHPNYPNRERHRRQSERPRHLRRKNERGR
jgi:hypothetical protein